MSITFQKYLKLNSAYIQVKNVYKTKPDYKIDITKLQDDNNYFDVIIDKIEKSEIKKVSDVDKLFKNFIVLGKNLYTQNKNNLNKIRVAYTNAFSINITPTLITNNLNTQSEELLKEWISKNFLLTVDKDLANKYFIETTSLIDLSIFVYLVTESFKNFYLNKSDKNKIDFNTFIICNSNNLNYLSIITSIIDEFEERFRKYIKESTKLVYDKENEYFRPFKIFDNIYSLMWYVFKLYLSFLSLSDTGEVLSKFCISCGGNVTNSKNRLCDECRKNHPSIRRSLNRENKKNIEEIKTLITGQTFPITLQNRIDMVLAKKNSYKNNLLIKHLLKDIKEYLNS